MLRRYELTDEEWLRIEPLLPPENTGKQGRPRKDNRIIMNGIVWLARSGAPWRDLPERYGSQKDVYKRQEDKLEALRSNPGIIRNRLKIQAAVTNACAFLEIQKEYGSFSDYIWHWTDGKVVYETGRTSSELSDCISKDLKKRGMKFVGTTVIYAYLQAVGVLCSHEQGCFLANQEAEHYNSYS